MNLLADQNQTAMCCPSLEWRSAGSVAVPEAKPAPAVTVWPTVENTTRHFTGSTHTKGSVVAKVGVLYCIIKIRKISVFSFSAVYILTPTADTRKQQVSLSCDCLSVQKHPLQKNPSLFYLNLSLSLNLRTMRKRTMKKWNMRLKQKSPHYVPR